jgi:hypothetical protein
MWNRKEWGSRNAECGNGKIGKAEWKRMGKWECEIEKNWECGSRKMECGRMER